MFDKYIQGQDKDYCQGKTCYDKKGAKSAKNKRWRQDRVKLRIYHCLKCNMWHLTKQPYRPDL